MKQRDRSEREELRFSPISPLVSSYLFVQRWVIQPPSLNTIETKKVNNAKRQKATSVFVFDEIEISPCLCAASALFFAWQATRESKHPCRQRSRRLQKGRNAAFLLPMFRKPEPRVSNRLIDEPVQPSLNQSFGSPLHFISNLVLRLVVNIIFELI